MINHKQTDWYSSSENSSELNFYETSSLLTLALLILSLCCKSKTTSDIIEHLGHVAKFETSLIELFSLFFLLQSSIS